MSDAGSNAGDEVPKVVLGKETISQGLTQIQKTADGTTYAFAVLNLEEKELDDIGDLLSNYEHIRDLNLNKNKIESIDKLRSLRYLQVLTA